MRRGDVRVGLKPYRLHLAGATIARRLESFWVIRAEVVYHCHRPFRSDGEVEDVIQPNNHGTLLYILLYFPKFSCHIRHQEEKLQQIFGIA